MIVHQMKSVVVEVSIKWLSTKFVVVVSIKWLSTKFVVVEVTKY